MDFLLEEYTELAVRLSHTESEYDVEEIVEDMGCIERKIDALSLRGDI